LRVFVVELMWVGDRAKNVTGVANAVP
jgi:hypothetical protein